MQSDSVLEALEEQVGCYRRLARLVELQHEHVRQSRTEELLAVLAQRQQVLDQVVGLEQNLQPAKGRWTEYLDGLPTDQRDRGRGLLAESRQLLEQITTADRNDALVLQQRKLNVGKQLRQAAAARGAGRQYAALAGSRPAAMDVRS
jgi:hypothetical protein